ncbi:MAG: TRAP transporter large permease subunit, partial [Pseudomonadota bacterium]
PTEAAAAGSLAAIALAWGLGRLNVKQSVTLLREAAQNASSILLLIVAAGAFATMLTLSGVPAALGQWVAESGLGLSGYVLMVLVFLIPLGMVLDSVSILLIVIPLAVPAVKLLGGDLIWFGVVAVIGVEIGLLTPPLGLSVYAIKSSLEDQSITLGDIFSGALPFAIIMVAVAVLLVFFPQIALWL